MLHRAFDIAGKPVGAGAPCFIIAEAGVNHNGNVDLALELIDVAASAGADAVKFQTFDASRLASRLAPKAAYQIANTGETESQYEMLQKLQLTSDQYRALKARCEHRGIIFLSTPFDEQSADLLEELDVAAYKIPSGELTNMPFLEHVARFKKPTIVSTGMATLAEVEAAVTRFEQNGCHDIAILHCVSNYPAAPAEANLRAMETMRRAFLTPVGYSDHTEGSAIALASVALGASVLEKHFTLDRSMAGPDHRASIQPDELHALVREVRVVESALGDGRKMPMPSERNTAAVARKSVTAKRDIEKGVTITSDMLISLRPGTGLPPAVLPAIVGRTARTQIPAGTLLDWDMIG